MSEHLIRADDCHEQSGVRVAAIYRESAFGLSRIQCDVIKIEAYWPPWRKW